MKNVELSEKRLSRSTYVNESVLEKFFWLFVGYFMGKLLDSIGRKIIPQMRPPSRRNPIKIPHLMEIPVLATFFFLFLVFGTMWLFYIQDGIEGAKVAWNFGGPIIGAAAGYWFGRPLRE